MYSPQAYSDYGTTRYNDGRSQGRKDVGSVFTAGTTYSLVPSSTASYPVEANHYYLFTGTVGGDNTAGIAINSGATVVGQFVSDSQNGVKAISLLVKTTSTTVVAHLANGTRGVITAIKLGSCQ